MTVSKSGLPLPMREACQRIQVLLVKWRYNLNNGHSLVSESRSGPARGKGEIVMAVWHEGRLLRLLGSEIVPLVRGQKFMTLLRQGEAKQLRPKDCQSSLATG